MSVYFQQGPWQRGCMKLFPLIHEILFSWIILPKSTIQTMLDYNFQSSFDQRNDLKENIIGYINSHYYECYIFQIIYP